MSSNLQADCVAGIENTLHKPHYRIPILAAAVLIVACIGCSSKKSEPNSSSPDVGTETTPKASLRSVEPLRVGQTLSFERAGAYTHGQSNWFNGVSLPSLYSHSEAEGLTLERRFTFQDFARRCAVPGRG